MSNVSEDIVNGWDVDAMANWLRKENLHDCVRPFLLKKINGFSFLNLSEYDLKTFQISADSRRKLTKLLKRMKAKKSNAVHISPENGSRGRREAKVPSAPIPTHAFQQDDGEIDGWGSDFDSEDEFDDEHNESCSDGEYIDPEVDESQNATQKEIANNIIQGGLVAQLRAGLNINGSMQRNCVEELRSGLKFNGNMQTNCTDPAGEDIYDLPPDEEEDVTEELYEEPSDDSGSAIVVRPLDKKKIIRCPSSERGEYIDARAPKYIDKGETDPCPPPPSRPPKSGPKLIKPPPTKKPPTPPPEPELYEEVTDEDQPGCSQVLEENSVGVEVYQPWDNDPIEQQENYEVPDTHEGDTYEVPDDDEQETYEIVDGAEQAPPGRPPPRGAGCSPSKRPPEQEKPKPSLFKKPLEQKPAKPMPSSKPQFSPKPSAPNPPLEKRSSRLYPNPSKPGSLKRNSEALPPPPTKQKVFPPHQNMSQKKEENINERRVINEISKKVIPSPKLPPPRKQTPPSVNDDSPPLPPRPGAKPPLKGAKVSDSNNRDGAAGPTSPITKTPLPPVPSQPKGQNDRLKGYPWFHGPLDKKVAEDALKACGKQGAFIVRNSSKDPNNYSMSLLYLGNVKHLRIPRTNNKFVLGDSGTVEFNTIEELVAHYNECPVDLRSGGSTTLTVACPVK